MALLTPPFALGAAGQVVSGRNLRHAVAASFIPGLTGVTALSGVLHGPPNTMGELTLVSNAEVTVQPFRGIVPNLDDQASGAYLVVNDALVSLAVTAQHATQFRKSVVLVEVDDSQTAGVASSATTDRARLFLLDGALAATAGAAATPALPNNRLTLGELTIPPVGQAVTLSAYNPRTTTRHGILPVLETGTNRQGHTGFSPYFDGQYRDVASAGLQRGKGGVWRSPFNRYLYRATELGAFAAAEITAEPKHFMGRTYCPFGGLSYSVVSLNYTLAGFIEPPQILITPGNENSYALYGGYDQNTAATCIAVIRSGVNIAGGTEISWLAIGR